jgi:protein arginine kinase activator
MGERPVECSACKKPIKIIYKEIVDGSILCTEMCADCPILQHKLHKIGEKAAETEQGLCCGRCGTTLESIKTGSPLGCSECYAIFSTLIIGELIARDLLPASLKQTLITKKQTPIHIGKSPGKVFTFAPSNRIIALTEALNDALRRENYEEAASLRDQIKALTEQKQDDRQS